MKRFAAALILVAVLVPLAASILMPMVERPAPACEFYAVPLRFTLVIETPHPRGNRYVQLPLVEFTYRLNGRQYTSRRLSCGPGTAGGEQVTERAFIAEAKREATTMVAWVPANDPAGGCISLARPFRYSLLNEVAAACRRVESGLVEESGRAVAP